MRKSKVTLSAADRERLNQFIGAGQALARQIKHALALQALDRGDHPSQIALNVGLSQRTIFRLEKRFAQQGLDATLHDKPRSGAPKKITGEAKALVVATACSEVPQGHAHWTLRMLAARLVELEVIEQISHESVRAILKKTSSNPGKKSNGAFPE